MRKVVAPITGHFSMSVLSARHLGPAGAVTWSESAYSASPQFLVPLLGGGDHRPYSHLQSGHERA